MSDHQDKAPQQTHVAWDESGSACVCAISGPLLLPRVADVWRALGTHAFGARADIRVDCAGITELDSAGVAALVTFVRTQKARGHTVTLDGLRPKHSAFIGMLGGEEALVNAVPARPPHRDTAGPVLLTWWGDFRDMVVFMGRTAAGVVSVLRRPSAECWKEVAHCLQLSGPGAVPVVCTITFLVGFVVAFQAATQLERFNAQIMVAQLVGFALFRELAPIMTSVIMAGRTGSAFAAEIGTMKVSEELDAMEVMLLNPYRYLVAPKILASLVAFPCLTMLADLAGLLGGVFVGAQFLNIPAYVFLKESFQNMTIGDLGEGLYKSVIFACLVAGIGCLRGMQVRLGADSVGRAATSAAVSGIFLTIIADALITMSGYML
ncbi:MlaE family lipid ABC transporter permease subunit [bacterium]|nr:MlaE family lipid ABC transporter permease subunit [bacterium]